MKKSHIKHVDENADTFFVPLKTFSQRVSGQEILILQSEDKLLSKQEFFHDFRKVFHVIVKLLQINLATNLIDSVTDFQDRQLFLVPHKNFGCELSQVWTWSSLPYENVVEFCEWGQGKTVLLWKHIDQNAHELLVMGFHDGAKIFVSL